VDTTATFVDPGDYVLRLTVADDHASVSDEVVVTVKSVETEVVLEAETMPVKTTGVPVPDGWGLKTNGYIEETVAFPSSGEYELQVTARGDYAGAAWPIMEIRLDRRRIAITTVSSTSWRDDYRLRVYVPAGEHRVAVAFINDFYRKGQGDRNLYIDKVKVTAPLSSVPPREPITLEAEAMPIKTTGGSVADGWALRSNGYIENTVDFPVTGPVQFTVIARGDLAAGMWPRMEIRIDGQAVALIKVNSDTWAPFTVIASVSGGSHRVAIAFTNDYYRPPYDRNLYVDKVEIHAQ
jgi:hypothetical protein